MGFYRPFTSRLSEAVERKGHHGTKLAHVRRSLYQVLTTTTTHLNKFVSNDNAGTPSRTGAFFTERHLLTTGELA